MDLSAKSILAAALNLHLSILLSQTLKRCGVLKRKEEVSYTGIETLLRWYATVVLVVLLRWILSTVLFGLFHHANAKGTFLGNMAFSSAIGPILFSYVS